MHVNKSGHKLLPLFVAMSLCLNYPVFAATQPNAGTILNNPGAPGPATEKPAPGVEIGPRQPGNAPAENGPKIKVFCSYW